MIDRSRPHEGSPSAAVASGGQLYHGSDVPEEALRDLRGWTGVDLRAISSLSQVSGPGGTPTLVLLDGALAGASADPEAAIERLPPAVAVVAVRDGLPVGLLRHPRIFLRISSLGGSEEILPPLQAALRYSAASVAFERAERELARTRDELDELSRIGALLMTERDPDRLLHRILEQARRLTGSDAGSLYLAEESGGGVRLRFKLSQNDSLRHPPFGEFTLPIDHSSLAGYVAATGTTVMLEDAYRTQGAPFTLNRDFDRSFGYRTKSLLVVPMISQRGRLVGVLQIINRKTDPHARITDEESAERYVTAYVPEEQRLVDALAGQASVAIENTRLYHQIEQLFDSFVRASVTAIEQRDPTTAGHSLRVAEMSCALAEALSQRGDGPYAGWRIGAAEMRELRYAALLHDFGKIGVREEVLVKAKKLPPVLAERVDARFRLIRRSIESEYHRARADYLHRHGREAFAAVAPRLEREYRERLAEVERVHGAVHRANEPTVLPEEAAGELAEMARRSYPGIDGLPDSYLTGEELRFLSIARGTLDDAERREIESHVEQTYRFLLQIPWTDDLKGVAPIAYGHHEKMNGMGYPQGARAEEIPVQSRIMAVADIFDALTASDRPYKKAMGYERALEILRAEARSGALDAAIVEVFVESEVYRRVL